MGDSVATIAPIVGFFLIGVALSRARLATAPDGQFLLRLLFFIALPALSLVTLADAALPKETAWLPIGCAIVNFTGLGLAWLVGTRRGYSRELLGTTALGTMILNNAFLVPFVLAGYGAAGLTDLILFDLGNALVVSLVAYPLAFRFGGLDTNIAAGVRRALAAPFTWAIATGIGFNLADAELPDVADRFFSSLGALVGPLILIALGILFRPTLDGIGQVVTMVALRMGCGLVIGFALVSLLGLHGDTRIVVLLAASSPIGFTALTFSSMASLDEGAAARAVSASLLVGVVAVPIVVAATS